MSIVQRIAERNAKRQQQEEPVQFKPFGEAYMLVKELVAAGWNINNALAFHNVKISIAEHRALQVVANERDQYLIAR